MNRKTPNPSRHFCSWQPAGVVVVMLLAALIIGCGRSPDTPADSDPVGPRRTDSGDPLPLGETRGPRASEETGDPPGTLVLPDDFNPESQTPLTPVTPDAQSPQRGFEMPAVPEGVQAPEQTPNQTRGAGTTGAAPPAEGADDVSLTAAPWNEIAQTVSSTGQVTVVDVWSLGCEPCLQEFPGLVAIHRDLGERVACISVNVDFDGRRTRPPESYRPRVEGFLASVDAAFPNYLSETPSEEVFAELDIVSIPAVLIYDAEGNLIRRFIDAGEDAGFTYADNVRPFVQQLLEPAS
jgi:thiol-disulfide isomerase/thioredoxin